MPNFNYTYFNSPSVFNTPNANNYNSSFALPNTQENIQNNSSHNKSTTLGTNKNINENFSIDKDISNTVKANSFDFSNLFRMSGNTVSILGFSIDIDDLIIIGVLIFLIYEKCDDIYLIILLGLLFFDIKLDFWR